MEDAIDHLKSIKLNSYLGENVELIFSTILVYAENPKIFRGFNTDNIR